jgi:hypothetical protein
MREVFRLKQTERCKMPTYRISNVLIFLADDPLLFFSKISILKRVGSSLVPRGVCRFLIGCAVIVRIVTTYLRFNKIAH